MIDDKKAALSEKYKDKGFVKKLTGVFSRSKKE